MPTELEKNIENLDEVFHKQWAQFNEAADFVKKGLQHETMGNWQHISRMLVACQRRIKVITGDYIRAVSYPSMRIINTRMTDVLNVINPIHGFMQYAIERCEKAKEEECEKTLEEAKLETFDELELKKSDEENINQLEEEKLPKSEETELKKVEELEYKRLEIEKSKVIIGAKPAVEDPPPPEENNLLLDEAEEKPNQYDGPPRRRAGGLLACFGR